MGAIAWVSAWWLTLRILLVPFAWVWTGIGVAAYSVIFYWFGANILLGNINHLVLGLLAAFIVAHVRGSDRVGGLLLGLAIAIKLWPVALVVPLLRGRRWKSTKWAIVTAAIATAIPLAWLGPEAIAPMIESMRLRVPIEPGVAVLWATALREMWSWWPTWGSIALAVVLLAIPMRGLGGIGLAIIAGVSVIPNIWDHYLPTLLVALALLLTRVRVPTYFPWSMSLRMRRAAPVED